jgi:hypothetical protein
MQFECKVDGEMPKEFMEAVNNGAQVQVKTDIGWLTISESDLEYRNNVEYRIKPD